MALYALTTDHRPHGIALIAVVVAFAGTLAVIDVRTYLLPNRIVAPLAMFGFVQAAGISLATGDASRLLIALGTALIIGAFYLGLALSGSFGLGDGKFAAALALSVAVYASWLTLYVVALAIVLGAMQRVALLVLGRDQSSGRAHGPAIAIAGLTLLLVAVIAGT